jgi:hypothetical protein
VPESFHRFIRWIPLLLISLIVLTLPAACADPASQLKPAEFEVQDISINPDEVMPGDDVTITVTVKNIGDLAGIYTVVLKMGQSDIDTYDLPVTANTTNSIDFEIKAPDSGIYQFSVDDITKSLQVYEWQKYKIVYDKCMGSLGEWGFGYTIYDPDAGFMSYFQAPSKFFRVNKLLISGFWRPFELPNPEDYEFTINIRDDHPGLNIIWSKDFSYSRFRNEGTLQEFEVPGIRTDGDFYVEIITHSERTATPDPVTGKYPAKHALMIGLCVRTEMANAILTYRGYPQEWIEGLPAEDSCSFIVRVEGEGSP